MMLFAPRSLLQLIGTTSVAIMLAFAPPTPAAMAEGATTLTSKQKVSVIIDRDRTPQQTTLLVKIIVPDDAKVEAFDLAGPARLVVDFVGVKIKTSETLKPPKNEVISQIRLGAHPEKLRIVMDLSTDKVPQYEWKAGTRQATFRIVESVNAAADSAPAPAAPPPASVPTQLPTPVPTEAPTVEPTSAPIEPTEVPTAPPTATMTSAPTSAPTVAPTVPPTFTSTPVPVVPTAAEEPPATQPTKEPAPAERSAMQRSTQPKLPDMTDAELEAALDREVARVSAAMERGEDIGDPADLEGEDLVDVSGANVSGSSIDEEPELDLSDKGDEKKEEPQAKGSTLASKDIPIAGAQPKSETSTGLRANTVPLPAITDFKIESADYRNLEPGNQPAFRFGVNRTGAQAQMSKVDPTTYKLIISNCGLANLGLSLPQYPPADFKGLLAVTSKTQGDSVEVTIQVDQGVSLATLVRDKEIWVKVQ